MVTSNSQRGSDSLEPKNLGVKETTHTQVYQTETNHHRRVKHRVQNTLLLYEFKDAGGTLEAREQRAEEHEVDNSDSVTSLKQGSKEQEQRGKEQERDAERQQDGE